MKKRKLFIGAMTLIYLSLTVNIGYCADYPTEVHHYERNHQRVIEQIYELNHDQEPSDKICEDFAQDGYFYTLEQSPRIRISPLIRKNIARQSRLKAKAKISATLCRF